MECEQLSPPRGSGKSRSRSVAKDSGSVGGSAWREGGYLCTGGCPCCIFPAVKRQFSEAPDPGAFISLKAALNNKLRESRELFADVWNSDKHLLIGLPGRVHQRFMGRVSSPAPVLEVKPNIAFRNETPANKNKLTHRATSQPRRYI